MKKEVIVLKKSPEKETQVDSKSKDVCRSAPRGNVHLLRDFEWEFIRAETGAKLAYLLLKDILEFSNRDIVNLTRSKSYFIFSTEPLPNRGAALDLIIRSDLSRLRSRAIGCIIVSPQEYCFFWKRSENS